MKQEKGKFRISFQLPGTTELEILIKDLTGKIENTWSGQVQDVWSFEFESEFPKDMETTVTKLIQVYNKTIGYTVEIEWRLEFASYINKISNSELGDFYPKENKANTYIVPIKEEKIKNLPEVLSFNLDMEYCPGDIWIAEADNVEDLDKEQAVKYPINTSTFQFEMNKPSNSADSVKAIYVKTEYGEKEFQIVLSVSQNKIKSISSSNQDVKISYGKDNNYVNCDIEIPLQYYFDGRYKKGVPISVSLDVPNGITIVETSNDETRKYNYNGTSCDFILKCPDSKYGGFYNTYEFYDRGIATYEDNGRIAQIRFYLHYNTEDYHDLVYNDYLEEITTNIEETIYTNNYWRNYSVYLPYSYNQNTVSIDLYVASQIVLAGEVTIKIANLTKGEDISQVKGNDVEFIENHCKIDLDVQYDDFNRYMIFLQVPDTDIREYFNLDVKIDNLYAKPSTLKGDYVVNYYLSNNNRPYNGTDCVFSIEQQNYYNEQNSIPVLFSANTPEGKLVDISITDDLTGKVEDRKESAAGDRIELNVEKPKGLNEKVYKTVTVTDCEKGITESYSMRLEYYDEILGIYQWDNQGRNIINYVKEEGDIENYYVEIPSRFVDLQYFSLHFSTKNSFEKIEMAVADSIQELDLENGFQFWGSGSGFYLNISKSDLENSFKKSFCVKFSNGVLKKFNLEVVIDHFSAEFLGIYSEVPGVILNNRSDDLRRDVIYDVKIPYNYYLEGNQTCPINIALNAATGAAIQVEGNKFTYNGSAYTALLPLKQKEEYAIEYRYKFTKYLKDQVSSNYSTIITLNVGYYFPENISNSFFIESLEASSEDVTIVKAEEKDKELGIDTYIVTSPYVMYTLEKDKNFQIKVNLNEPEAKISQGSWKSDYQIQEVEQNNLMNIKKGVEFSAILLVVGKNGNKEAVLLQFDSAEEISYEVEGILEDEYVNIHQTGKIWESYYDKEHLYIIDVEKGYPKKEVTIKLKTNASKGYFRDFRGRKYSIEKDGTVSVPINIEQGSWLNPYISYPQGLKSLEYHAYDCDKSAFYTLYDEEKFYIDKETFDLEVKGAEFKKEPVSNKTSGIEEYKVYIPEDFPEDHIEIAVSFKNSVDALNTKVAVGNEYKVKNGEVKVSPYAGTSISGSTTIVPSISSMVWTISDKTSSSASDKPYSVIPKEEAGISGSAVIGYNGTNFTNFSGNLKIKIPEKDSQYAFAFAPKTERPQTILGETGLAIQLIREKKPEDDSGVSLENILIIPETKKMKQGDTQKISLKYIPENAVIKESVIWSVDKQELADISDTGELIAKKPGEVIVQAAVGRIEAEIMIIIEEDSSGMIPEVESPMGLYAITNISPILEKVNLMEYKNWSWEEKESILKPSAKLQSFAATFTPTEAGYIPVTKQVLLLVGTVLQAEISGNDYLQTGKSSVFTIKPTGIGYLPENDRDYDVEWNIISGENLVEKVRSEKQTELQLKGIGAGKIKLQAVLKLKDSKNSYQDERGKTYGKFTANYTVTVVNTPVVSEIQWDSLDGYTQEENGRMVFQYSEEIGEGNLKKGDILKFSVKSYDEEKRILENTKLKLSSSDSGVASVKWSQEAYEVQINGSGMTKLTAASLDVGGATSSLYLYVRDYTPKLERDFLFLNKNKIGSEILELYPAYETELQDIKIVSESGGETPFEVIQEKGVCYFRLKEEYKKGENYRNIFSKYSKLKLKLSVILEGQEIAKKEFPITIKVTDEKPLVRIKQLERLNLFYKDGKATITITSSEPIDQVSWKTEEEGIFTLREDEIKYSEDKMTAYIPVEQNGNAEQLNDFKNLSRKQKEIFVKVKSEGYTQAGAQEVMFSVRHEMKKPYLKLEGKFNTMYPSLNVSSAAISLYDKREKETIILDESYHIRWEKEGREYAKLLKIPDIVQGKLVIRLAEDNTKKGTTAKIMLGRENWREEVKLSRRINVSENVKVLLSQFQINLNQELKDYEEALVSLKVNGNEGLSFDRITLEGTNQDAQELLNLNKLKVSYDKNEMKIKLMDSAVVALNKNKTFTYQVIAHAGQTELQPVKFKIKIMSGKPELVIKVRDSVDLINREQSVAVCTPYLKNIDGKLKETVLLGSGAFLFDTKIVTEGKDSGKIVIKAKQGENILTDTKYQLSMKVRLDNGYSMITDFSVLTRQSVPKVFVNSTKATLFSSSSAGKSFTFSLDKAEGIEIERIELATRKEDMILEEGEMPNTILLKVNEFSGLKTNKTYPVKLKITFKDSADNAKPVYKTVKIVYKK